MAALLAADVSGGHRGVHAVRRAQIHLASWMDWFPAPGQASAAFVDLSTVFAAYDREWRREGLADPDGFGGFKPLPVLGDRVNAPALARRDVFACPRFLAAGDPPAPLPGL